ncbi:hypothetical protein [Haloglomus litoreum]|uniref:hypothetical protein n=1 Tax=Haloglomus litoreum TaxID=3034026 RepID=UPI0023E89DB9|nr:hypothetical protein [Haloglomus sp. DT116]
MTTFQQESGTAPNIAFGYQYEGHDNDSTRDLQIVVDSENGGIEADNSFGGEHVTFGGEHVTFVCKEGSCGDIHEWTFDDVTSGSGPDGRFIAGDTLTLDASPSPPEIDRNAILRIRWEEPAPQGKTVIVGVWRGPAA